MARTHEVFAHLEEALLTACRKVYGRRLVSLAVFGSVARGTARPDSDLDCLIVAEALPQGRGARVREFELVDQEMAHALAEAEKLGVHTLVAPVFKTPEEARRGSVLFWDMTQEAKILFDRDGFLAALLDEVRTRLEKLGARRIVRDSTSYWDLKPDYRPGEIFELWPISPWSKATIQKPKNASEP